MQVCTGDAFDAASIREGDADDPVLWLDPRYGERRPSGRAALLEGLDRVGNRVGRAAGLLALACIASAVASNTALAPVGTAHAAIARLRLEPALPSRPEHLAAPVERVRVEAVMPLFPTHAAVPATTHRTDLTGVREIVPALSAAETAGPAVSRADLGASGSAAVRVEAPAHHVDMTAADLEEAARGLEEEIEALLSFGSRTLPRRLVETIVRAAARTEVDPIYLMALADKESSFRTEVKAATSSAEGLFQFIESTWLDTLRSFGAKHGYGADSALILVAGGRAVVEGEAERGRILALRRDPYLSALMAGELLRRDAAQIAFRIGRELDPAEMYLAHFLGKHDAARFIELRQAKKAQSATKAFPRAARANAAIFFERGRRGRRNGLSVPEVYAKIDRMIDSRIDLFRSVGDFSVREPAS